MDKGHMSSSSGHPTAPMPSAPLPTAPPSYEEAVGLMTGPPMPPPTQGAPIMHPPAPGGPPYPVAGAPMPMPTQYPTTAPQMPMPITTQHMPVQQQPTETRTIHQTVVLTLGPNPIKMSCPTCHTDIKTTTMSDHQPSAHICCIILCLLGCCLCSCLPYCSSAFLSVNHFCPNCKAYIGTWKG